MSVTYIPHVYQQHSTQHIISNTSAGLFLDMGLGKTVSTLTAIDTLIYDMGEVNKVLVIAPKRVAENTWTDEIGKWAHLKSLKVSKILGDPKKRKEALATKADIYIINRENVVWLVATVGSKWPFDMVVIDELSSFKSQKSGRFKALRRVRPFCKRVVGLTGTPAPNGLIDLWAQLYLLDRGKRLGEHITPFREAYFTRPYKVDDKVVRGYELQGDNKKDLDNNPSAVAIFDKIKDICISMKKEDWLELPKRVDVDRTIRLSPEIMAQYYQFEREQVLELLNAETLTAVNAAGLTNKLLQFANGAVYNDEGGYVEIHNEKIDALEELVESANGNPMLVFYSFRSDVERIKKYLKHLKPHILNSTKDMHDWNSGKIPFALAHPASAGHGLNLQSGGNLMGWFQLTWSLELYLQAVARLDRQGQTKSVINNRLLVASTMDYDVLSALDDKFGGQEALMRAVKARISKYVS